MEPRIRVVAMGGGWSVLLEGKLVPRGVHKTKGSAYQQALTLSEDRPQLIEIEGGLDGTDREHYDLK